MPEITSRQVPETNSKACTSLTGVFVRLGWVFFGNAALFFSGVAVFKQHGAYGLPDIALGVSVLVLLAFRYVDIQFFDGKTLKFEPATMAHWLGYAWRLVLGSAVFWSIAHVGGYAVALP